MAHFAQLDDKNIVQELKSKGFSEGQVHQKVFRPWGSYSSIANESRWQVKLIKVKPGESLSLQKHQHRAEHWLITQGNPKITLNKSIFNKKPNEHIFIPLEAKHRIQNPGKKTVKIMEAQIGSILKESDIVRYKDVYGRIN